MLATLSEVESSLLGALLDQLDEVAAELDDEQPAGDPVIERLYPAGYRDDPKAADDFRELTQSSLRQERRERYGQCRAELPPGGGELSIEPESAQRWLIVLNDMRLALGTRLGVTADGFADTADEQTHDARAAYLWLTAVQDDLVEALVD